MMASSATVFSAAAAASSSARRDSAPAMISHSAAPSDPEHVHMMGCLV